MIVGPAMCAGFEKSGSSDGRAGVSDESSADLVQTGGKSKMPDAISPSGVVTLLHGAPVSVADISMNGVLAPAGIKTGAITVRGMRGTIRAKTKIWTKRDINLIGMEPS
jgi:hypothetical protein